MRNQKKYRTDIVNEIVGMGGEAIVNGCNVADFDAAGSMIEEAVDKWGRIARPIALG